MQQRPTPIKKPEGPKVEPAPIRERIVKRFVAFCAFDDTHKFTTPHTTKDAAIVEAVRHLRADHADTFYVERKAISRAEVIRKPVGVELVDE